MNFLNISNFFTVAGIRIDYTPNLNLNSVDPRIGIGYKTGKKSTIRMGWGIFHQTPDARLFSIKDGNPNLKSMKATHYVASYDYQMDDKNSFRVEAYYKDYKTYRLKIQQQIIQTTVTVLPKEWILFSKGNFRLG